MTKQDRPERTSGLFFFACLTFAFWTSASYAGNWETAFAQARLQGLTLHDHTQWLRLLHMPADKNDVKSDILSTEFFLSPKGMENPGAELEETLRQFQLPIGDDPDSHASCRFPARHLWLGKQLNVATSFDHCRAFLGWSELESVSSISLMLISGYFGNPASTFGHVLMKVNAKENDSTPSLLDMGINYGALVPPDEPTPVYILRGLFGGYQAGFSDRDFYQYDQTYSRTEFRNMWEYELALTDYQRTLLLSHLWEIAGKKMRYFFLKENCAYRLAQLMELVTQEPFVENVDLWYAPISIFNRLNTLDDERPEGDRYISSITFVPSDQERLYASIALLSREDQQRFTAVIQAADPLTAARRLDELPTPRAARLLETLLAYYQFRLAGEEKEKPENRQLAIMKDHVLRERLRLPARASTSEVQVPDRRSPGAGEPPSLLGFGLGHQDEGGSHALLRYAPFHFDAIGNNELNRSSLIVLDTTVRLDTGRAPRLDRLDVIRVRKTNRDPFQLPGTSAASWEVAAGYRQERRDCDGCGALFAESLLGRSYDISSSAVATGSLGLSAQSGENELQGVARGTLEFGAVARWSAELGIEYRAGLLQRDAYLTGVLRGRLSLDRKRELRIELGEDRGLYGRIAIAHRW